MRLEGRAALVDLAQSGEAHHLKAPGVGEDGVRPVHELVQAAESGDPLRAGREHQMIGVGEHDVVAERPHRLRMHRLYRRGCSDRHERGSADYAARRRDRAETRLPVGRVDGKGKFGAHRRSASSPAGAARGQQAGVPVRIEAISGLNCVRICGAHGLKSAEGRDEHEERRARQMKVGHERVDEAKAVSGADENVGFARKRPDSPSLVSGALEDARRGRAHADDPASPLPHGVERFGSRSIDRAPLGLHLVVARVLDFDGRESPGADMQRDAMQRDAARRQGEQPAPA